MTRCTLARWPHAALFCAALLGLATAHAQPADEARGLWLSAKKDAVIEFKACPELATALCGTIVWDSEAQAKPQSNDCGVRVVQVHRFDHGAWRDGWAYDPRDKKNYKAAVRVRDGTLRIRAFIGAEILGQTEELTRTDKVPSGCPAKPPT